MHLVDVLLPVARTTERRAMPVLVSDPSAALSTGTAGTQGVHVRSAITVGLLLLFALLLLAVTLRRR
jgi:hypothetical protein